VNPRSVARRALSILCLLPFLCAGTVSRSPAGTLHEDLVQEMNRAPADQPVSAIVTLAERLDFRQLEREMAARGIHSRWRRHEYVLRAAQSLADRTQGPLLEELRAGQSHGSVLEVESFWVVNCIVVKARPEFVSALSLRGDVGLISLNREIDLRLGVDVPSPGGAATEEGGGSRDLQHSLQAINVEPAWNLGYTGAGRMVCAFDTGADANHPALAAGWRGSDPGVPWYEAWKDPYTYTEFPYDTGNHGTHVLGIMVADPPNQTPMVGVAYDAKWIAAGVIIGYDVQKILECYQWAVDPDGNPSTIEDVPDVINNSWGTHADCDQTYWEAIDLVEAAGIVNTIAVDNTGPGPMTVNSPESRIDTPYVNFGVGAVDTYNSGLNLYAGSGRGPSPCDSVTIKPEMTAPGVAVYSTVPGGGYTWKTGTSMACPHTSGAAALLRQVNPSLTVDQVKQAMMDTAQDLGDPGEDNGYGWGLLDVGAAVDWVLQNYPPPMPPRQLTGHQIDDGSVELLWRPPDPLSPVDSLVAYNIYRAPELMPYPEDPLMSITSADTTYIDSEPPLGVFRYVVTAVYQSGAESEPSNQVTVWVRDLTAAPDSAPTGGPLELAVRPNPAWAGAELVLRASGPFPVSVGIFDASGRRVRILEAASRDAGPLHTFSFDGNDEAGHRLPAGAYFVRARIGKDEAISRLVLISD